MATEKRLIDANDALERLKKAEKEMKVVSLCGCKAVPMDGVIDFVASRPTVDAVEVVRCRDCKNWSERTGFCDEHSRFFNHGMYWDMFNEDDFCSYGERKDNA